MAQNLAKNNYDAFCKQSEEYIKKSFLAERLFAPDRGGE